MKTYNDPLHIGWDRLTIRYNDKEVFILNKRFLDSQNCWTNLEDIKETFWLKYLIYDMIENTKDKKLLKELAKDLTEIEFELQRLFLFKPNVHFHRFWNTPKCTCSKLDNEERFGTEYKIINPKCPLHGD